MEAFPSKDLLLQLIELDETVPLDHNSNVCNDVKLVSDAHPPTVGDWGVEDRVKDISWISAPHI